MAGIGIEALVRIPPVPSAHPYRLVWLFLLLFRLVEFAVEGALKLVGGGEAVGEAFGGAIPIVTVQWHFAQVRRKVLSWSPPQSSSL